MRKLTKEEIKKDVDSERNVKDACLENSSAKEATEINRGFNLKASDIRGLKRPAAVLENLELVCEEETLALPFLEESNSFEDGKDSASRSIKKKNWQ